MTNTAWDEFEQHLSCEERLLADSEPLPWPPSTEDLQRLAERNANVLATLAALEERRADLDDNNPLVQEMQRMDAKLTALVEIVNRWLAPPDTLPSRHALRFNAIGALLPAALLPTQGEGLRLRLRFDVCRSLPLEFAAHRERVLDDGSGFVAFAMPADASSDALERLVFRHHRRKVAGSRQLTV